MRQIGICFSKAIINSFLPPSFERRQVIFGYCDEITRPAAFALESEHHLTTFSAVLFWSQLRCLNRLGDIALNGALLVCLSGIQGFTCMNLGSSFL